MARRATSASSSTTAVSLATAGSLRQTERSDLGRGVGKGLGTGMGMGLGMGTGVGMGMSMGMGVGWLLEATGCSLRQPAAASRHG